MVLNGCLEWFLVWFASHQARTREETRQTKILVLLVLFDNSKRTRTILVLRKKSSSHHRCFVSHSFSFSLPSSSTTKESLLQCWTLCSCSSSSSAIISTVFVCLLKSPITPPSLSNNSSLFSSLRLHSIHPTSKNITAVGCQMIGCSMDASAVRVGQPKRSIKHHFKTKQTDAGLCILSVSTRCCSLSTSCSTAVSVLLRKTENLLQTMDALWLVKTASICLLVVPPCGAAKQSAPAWSTESLKDTMFSFASTQGDDATSTCLNHFCGWSC